MSQNRRNTRLRQVQSAEITGGEFTFTYAYTEIILHSFPVSSLPSKEQDGSMSQYTTEYLQEKLQKELNPIHLVRSTGLVLFESISEDLYFKIGYFNCLIRQLIWGNASIPTVCNSAQFFPPPPGGISRAFFNISLPGHRALVYIQTFDGLVTIALQYWATQYWERFQKDFHTAPYVIIHA